MITIEALQHAISERIERYNQTDNPIQTRQTQSMPLVNSLNHILAQEISSPFDVPRQNLSAMDGYAIAKDSKLDDAASIEIIGESQAGTPFDPQVSGELQANQGVRIFTGAIVPPECDIVIMQENTNFAEIKDSIDKSQPYQITLTQSASIEQNIRKQGEEIQADEVLLNTGKRINPADISLLANLGVAEVEVFAPLTVGLLSTGDELVEIGEPLDSLAQIYNSNTPTLKSLLADLPVTLKDYGIIPDDLQRTTQAVTNAMNECDVLISTAGVSVGDYDFLTTVIENLGQINHYKVAMKPGKPFVFGELFTESEKGSKTPVLYFGLPGNPLSAVVGTLTFIHPALWQCAGVNRDDMPMTLTVQATLQNDLRKSVGRADFQRGVLTQEASGRFTVSGFAKQQSHRIKQLSQANCLIVLSKDSGNHSKGDTVSVQPFPWT